MNFWLWLAELIVAARMTAARIWAGLRYHVFGRHRGPAFRCLWCDEERRPR